MLNDTELYSLYMTKVRRPDEYFTQYEDVPPCPIRSWGNSWKDKDAPRCFTVLDFQKWIADRGISPERLGYTSESDPELELFSAKTKVYLPYPSYDLHVLSSHYREAFDFLLVNQTLEHLQAPHTAMKSMYDALVPGGYLFTSVPTINIPHSTPYHYGGYNPMGLAVMCLEAGFEICEIGQWGNLRYIRTLFDENGWPDVYRVAEPNGRVLNIDRAVCQCWILVQKPKLTNI
jgi:SAM-dependent methyltransferase